MSLDEIKKAIENRSIIQFIDNPNNWGIPTCLSDDESGVYYKKNGCGLFSYFTGLDAIELG